MRKLKSPGGFEWTAAAAADGGQWLAHTKNSEYTSGAIVQQEYMKHIGKLTRYCGLADEQLDDLMDHTLDQLFAWFGYNVEDFVAFSGTETENTKATEEITKKRGWSVSMDENSIEESSVSQRA